MNNTFSFKRFGLVFKKDLMENRKRYILLFLTMLGIMMIVFIFMTMSYYGTPIGLEPDHILFNRSLLSYMSFMFIACGIFFASSFSTPMNSKLKRITYLVSPSSNLEKYLTRWMITTVGYIFAFFIALWIADAVRVAIGSLVFPEADIQVIDFSKLIYPDEYSISAEYVVFKDTFVMILSVYFLVQSLFLLGSTFTEKATFIKTFVFISTLIVVFIVINRWAILLFYGNFERFGNVLDSFEVQDSFDRNHLFTFVSIVLSVFTLANWVLAFFRIRESEIIKRL